MTGERTAYLTLPELAALPALIHGFGTGEWPEEEFLAFSAAGGMTPVIMRQLHSDRIHRLGAAPPQKLEGDALMTDVPGLLLVIRTADCLPVFLVDPKRRAAAAVHCGWRGTEKRILEKAVRAMRGAYGSEPGDMLAALGPCIGASCYEVGPEVREGFLRAGLPPSVFTERGHVPKAHVPGRKALLDLRLANVWLLEGMGIAKANILEEGPACTHCGPALLSYRRDPRDTRRMVNFIGFLPFAF
jgi:YfiH family protein